MEYKEFIESKRIVDRPAGIEDPVRISTKLFPFQRDIVRWALRRGRAAIWADCGLGKTPMQLEWAKAVSRHTRKPVLILAPLAVAGQTAREGQKFSAPVTVCRSQQDVCDGVNVANYEMLRHFDPAAFGGVVLDESSILKSFDGATRTAIIEAFGQTPFRLACTATPAPNDFMELGNHAEFLGVLTRTEMLSTFFFHDGGETSQWTLKGHAERDFWRWVCSWAVTLRRPSDLGYADDGFTLPPLTMHEVVVPAEKPTNGHLFAVPAETLQDRIAARRETVDDRVRAVVRIVSETTGPFLIWCNLNSESEAIRRSIYGAVEVTGSMKPEEKESAMASFSAGEVRILVSKPSICGFGMNWQHCANIAFVGLSDSYEQFYQAVRRCWRFGQQKPVNVYVVSAETEGAVVANIKRKEEDSQTLARAMVEHTKEITAEELHGQTVRTDVKYETGVAAGDGWTWMRGDCVDAVRAMEDESVDFSVFSPPFASLYTYSASDRDMGNSRDHATFYEHFRFLVAELLRVIKPGRLVSFHCMNLPTSKARDGVIGIRDFRGELIRLFESVGFIFHSEVCIWKDPVTAMQRTKALGLLHKQIKKDSCMSRQGIPDYLVTMRKPGVNPEPVSHTNETFPVGVWQRYASPVWMDINPSDTLQFRSAREDKDERHICPLQLGVIRRAIELWTNPGDLVLSPFGGIASEGYVAIEMGRKFVGVELKKSYWEIGRKNLERASTSAGVEALPFAESISASEPGEEDAECAAG